jgi:hypothetical protein
MPAASSGASSPLSVTATASLRMGDRIGGGTVSPSAHSRSPFARRGLDQATFKAADTLRQFFGLLFGEIRN